MRCDGRRMLNQKGLQWDLKGKHAHAFPLTLEAPLMRLSVASLRRVVKGDLTIQFVPQALTSYGGLELLQPYVRRIAGVTRLRPAYVPDSKQAVPFLREIIDDLRGRFGRRVALEFRMDAAFFQQGIFRLLTARERFYALKGGYWSWLPLKQVAAACRRWAPVAPGGGGQGTGMVRPPR